MKKTMTMVTALVMAACMASCGSVNEKATNTAAKNDTSAAVIDSKTDSKTDAEKINTDEQKTDTDDNKLSGGWTAPEDGGFRVTGESPKTLRDQVFQLASIIPDCIYFYRSTCYFSDSVI